MASDDDGDDNHNNMEDFPLNEYYKRGKELGSGGFGFVYEYIADVTKIDDYFMNDRNLPKKVAVKQINKWHGDLDNEFKILQRIRHKHVVTLLGKVDGDKNDPRRIITKLYVPDLKKLVEKQKERGLMPDHHVAFIIRQIAEATDFIHKTDLMHRDLKPSNILFKSEEEIDFETVRIEQLLVKVTDFGLSKAHDSAVTQKSDMTNAGTEKYKAPEIPSGKYTKKVDIFSIAVITLELKGLGFDSIKIGNNRQGTESAFTGGVWNTEKNIGLPLMLFLQGGLMHDEKKRPTARDLLQQPFLNSNSPDILCSLSVTGGVRAIEVTSNFIFLRSNSNNLFVVDPLKMFTLDNITRKVDSSKGAEITALSTFGDYVALGTGNGKVKLLRASRSEQGLTHEISELYSHPGKPKKVAWLELNDTHVVVTLEKTLAIIDRKTGIVKTEDIKDISTRSVNMILSQHTVDKAPRTESILTIAEGRTIRQLHLNPQSAETTAEEAPLQLMDRFTDPMVIENKDHVTIVCIALDRRETDDSRVWVAAQPPHCVVLLADLRTSEVLRRFRAPHAIRQFIHFKELLLCHMEEEAMAYRLKSIPKPDDGGLREEKQKPRLYAFAKFGTSLPRMCALSDTYVLYASEDDKLKFISHNDIKRNSRIKRNLSRGGVVST